MQMQQTSRPLTPLTYIEARAIARAQTERAPGAVSPLMPSVIQRRYRLSVADIVAIQRRYRSCTEAVSVIAVSVQLPIDIVRRIGTMPSFADHEASDDQ